MFTETFCLLIGHFFGRVNGHPGCVHTFRPSRRCQTISEFCQNDRSDLLSPTQNGGFLWTIVHLLMVLQAFSSHRATTAAKDVSGESQSPLWAFHSIANVFYEWAFFLSGPVPSGWHHGPFQHQQVTKVGGTLSRGINFFFTFRPQINTFFYCTAIKQWNETVPFPHCSPWLVLSTWYRNKAQIYNQGSGGEMKSKIATFPLIFFLLRLCAPTNYIPSRKTNKTTNR